MAELRTRPPTGQVAFPLILVEGEEKSGKSVSSYKLSASPRVGRTFVFDLGEGTADEYAELGPYEVVELTGTFSDLRDQLKAATAIPPHEGRPNVIVIDDGTVLWDLLKDWAASRARNSKSGRKKLTEDPDTEVDIHMALWTDAKDRWYEVVNLLRTWPGIGVIIAKGKEVAKVQGGVPVAGQTEWKVDAEKGLAFACSAWVRMTRPHTATLLGARSLHVDVPAKGLLLPPENPLEHLIFEVLGAGGDFAESTRVAPSVGTPKAEAKNLLVERLKAGGQAPDVAVETARALWDAGGFGDELSPAEVEAMYAAADEALTRTDEFEVGDNAPGAAPIDPEAA